MQKWPIDEPNQGIRLRRSWMVHRRWLHRWLLQREGRFHSIENWRAVV